MAGEVGNTAVSEVTYGRAKEPHLMKTAYHPGTNQPITAVVGAPTQAICPHCGGQVTLRCRHRMNGTAVYFWRHLDNHNRECSSRSHAATASPPKARRRR